jgi:predicted nucleic-acid-binding protein
MTVGLDTNVIVRFLTNDDVKQSSAVKARLSKINESGNKAYVSKIVMLETVWVLTSVFEFEDRIVINGLDHFSQLSMVTLEDPDLITRIKGLYSDKGPGLADQFILADYVFNGCETVITFDRKAKKLDGFSGV